MFMNEMMIKFNMLGPVMKFWIHHEAYCTAISYFLVVQELVLSSQHLFITNLLTKENLPTVYSRFCLQPRAVDMYA